MKNGAENKKKREQIQMFCMDDMVPQDHLLRMIDTAIDWNFIYSLAVDKYSPDNGRASMDPIMLIKLPFIQYLYGIQSMRQTIKKTKVNVACRWFLSLEMMDNFPFWPQFGCSKKNGSGAYAPEPLCLQSDRRTVPISCLSILLTPSV